MRTSRLVGRTQEELYDITCAGYTLRLSLYAGLVGMWTWRLYAPDVQGGHVLVDDSYAWADRNRDADASFYTASLAHKAGIEAFDAKILDMTFMESDV